MEIRCAQCSRTKAEMACHIDVYNDFDGNPGELVCDDCIYDAATISLGPAGSVIIDRPEGYYHCAPGTFD